MPRKNPQHKARKQAARDRARTEHEAGFLQQKKRDQKRRARVHQSNAAMVAVVAAAMFNPQNNR
jgi:hypothetical protein